MSVRIDVVNQALTMLGEEEITSIEDESDRARIMKTHYYAARDGALETHEWTFAIKRWRPVQEANDPLWGAAFRYLIPSDIIRVLAVEPDRGSNIPPGTHPFSTIPRSIGRRVQTDYLVEGGYIITDESSIVCRGIRSMEDEGAFSPLFVQAFAANLAMMTCYAFTESNVKFNAMSALYQLKIREAKTRDGLQGSNKRIRNRSLLNAR